MGMEILLIMKVVVNDVAVKKDSGGVYSILHDLYEAAKNSDIDWIFILGDNLFEETNNIKVIVRNDLQHNYVKRVLFDFLVGSKFINKLDPDIYISMQNTVTFGVKVRQYVYIHTPLPFQKDVKFSILKKDQRKLAFYQYIVGFFIKFGLKLNKKVIPIFQTQWLCNELANLKLIDKETSLVLPPIQVEIPNGKVIIPKVEADKLFIFPSTPIWYKRHDDVVRAFQKSKISHTYKILFTITEVEFIELYDFKPKSSHIEFIGKKSRQFIIDTLKSGATLIFPSMLETYGLPLLEAKSVGSKIVVRDTDLMREVIGNYDKTMYFKNELDLIKIFNQFELNEFNFVEHISQEIDYKIAKQYKGGFNEFIQKELK